MEARVREVEGAYLPTVELVRAEAGGRKRRPALWVRVALAGHPHEVRLTGEEAEALRRLAASDSAEVRRGHVKALREKLPELAPYLRAIPAGSVRDTESSAVYSLDAPARDLVRLK
jgi:hypothetical protein